MPARGERHWARVLGETTYFTGRPCKNGHIAKRETGNGRCVECHQAWVAAHPNQWRAYALKNADKLKAYLAAYYQANIEQWKTGGKYKPTPEAIRARSAKRLRENPEKQYAAIKRWHQANREAVRADTRNAKAKRKLAPGKHTAADIRALYEAQQGRCAYCAQVLTTLPPKPVTVAEIPTIPQAPKSRLIVCGCGTAFWSCGRGRPPSRCQPCLQRQSRRPLPVAYHVDHDIPLARGGSNNPDNWVSSCSRCNLSKRDMTGAELRRARAA